MASQLFEPMSVSQILDRAFRLYRANFVRFIAIVAVVQIPIGLIMLGATGLLEEGTKAAIQPGAVPGQVEVDTSALVTALILFALAIVAMVFGQTLCNAALIKSVSESYLGNEVTVGEAYGFVLPKVGAIILAGVLVTLVVMVGLVLLIVPGIIFSLWYMLTTQAIVIEDLKAGQGMKRSKALASGNLGKIFGLVLVVGIISWLVNLLFQGVGGAVTANMPPASGQAVQALLNLVGQILVTPIGAAAMILVYYDLRIRKEGFDLEMLALSLGAGAEETPPDAGISAQ